MSDDWNKAIDGINERRKAEHEALQQKLGEPAVFVKDGEDPRFGIGYWRAKGGVVSYRRYANGYAPESRTEYTDDYIQMLYGLTKLQPKEK